MPGFAKSLIFKSSQYLPKIRPVAIVTGASRGMGARMAEMFAASYKSPILLHYHSDKSRDDIEKVASACEDAGSEVEIVQADITCPNDRVKLINSALRSFNRIDALFNAVRIKPREDLIFSETQAKYFMAINGIAPIALAKQAIPHLLKSKNGFLCNFGCATGKWGSSATLNDGAEDCYIPSIQYLLENTKELANRYNGQIRICAVCPTDTDLESEKERQEFIPPKDINNFDFDECFPLFRSLSTGDIASMVMQFFTDINSNGEIKTVFPNNKMTMYGRNDIPEPYRKIYDKQVAISRRQYNLILNNDIEGLEELEKELGQDESMNNLDPFHY